MAKTALPGAHYALEENWHPLTKGYRHPKREDAAKFADLCAWIKEDGLEEPIITLDRLVLDGIARACACVRVGRPIDFLRSGAPAAQDFYAAQERRDSGDPALWLARRHSDSRKIRVLSTKDTREYDEVHDPGRIPDGQFQTIVADPPWNVSHATNKYPTMPVIAIEAMGKHRPLCPSFNLPSGTPKKCKGCGVLQSAAEDCHLYLWAINGRLREALDVMDAWGFRYITQITWNKTRGNTLRTDGQIEPERETDEPELLLPDHGGQGVYYRGTTEQILFGVKGSMVGRTAQYDTQFYAPRMGGHSVKPDEYFWPMVMDVSNGPYLELFARRLWHGLDASKGDAVWGNQAPIARARKRKKQ